MKTLRPKTIKFRGAVYHRVASPETELLFRQGQDLYSKIIKSLGDYGFKPASVLDSETEHYEKDHYGEVTFEQSFSLDPDIYQEHYSQDYTGELIETVVSALGTAGFRHARTPEHQDDVVVIRFTNRPRYESYASGAASVVATLDPFGSKDPAVRPIPKVTISMTLALDL